MRAVGFSKITTRAELQKIIKKAIKNADLKAYTTVEEDCLYAEYHAYFGDHIGICVRGEYDDNNKFIYDYYFPFFDSNDITTYEDISVERHLEKLSFAGAVDDFKLGISMIFYLQSMITYLKYLTTDRLPLKGTSLTLTGLSDAGTILMPISKNPLEVAKARNYNMRKSRMVKEAADGNEKAITSLTLSDMDTLNYVQKHVMEEDIYTLVDTYFMPYGMECDLYSIMGEIIESKLVTNTLTKEEVYILKLNVNDVILDVCVNKEDVIGEVSVGRRYKGNIWLQGKINFPEEN